MAGGYGGSPAALQNVIDYITMASEGNSTDFGDLTVARSTQKRGGNSQTRGVFCGGLDPGLVNTMDYITIGSTGDAADFGDLSAATSQISGSESDGHGGLQS